MSQDIRAIRDATRQGTLLQLVQQTQDDATRSLIITLAREKDDDGRRLIFDAVCSGNVDVAKYVLSLLVEEEQELVINEQDDNSWTPLISACSCNHVDMVDWLLSIGADFRIQTRQKRTALFYAASKASGRLVRKLVDAYGEEGVNSALVARDSFGSTVFHRAVSSGNVDALSVLLEYSDTLGDFISTTTDANGETIFETCDSINDQATKNSVISLLKQHNIVPV